MGCFKRIACRGGRRRAVRGGATRFCMADTAQSHITGGHDGETRRDFLMLSAGALRGIGAAIAHWPFLDRPNPARHTPPPSTPEVVLAPIHLRQQPTLAR